MIYPGLVLGDFGKSKFHRHPEMITQKQNPSFVELRDPFIHPALSYSGNINCRKYANLTKCATHVSYWSNYFKIKALVDMWRDSTEIESLTNVAEMV